MATGPPPNTQVSAAPTASLFILSLMFLVIVLALLGVVCPVSAVDQLSHWERVGCRLHEGTNTNRRAAPRREWPCFGLAPNRKADAGRFRPDFR